MWHVWGRRDKYSVLAGNMKKVYHFEDTGLNRRVILKWMLN
jgi:hypothetical protein